MSHVVSPADPGFVRNLSDLGGRSFDCVVVGGGIHGASLLFELSRRGYRSLLVERRDFGRGASARSLRILHGGFRYLQSFDLSRFGESVEARRWFLRSFPEFTSPRSFLLPLDGKGVRHPIPFSVAFAIDAWLSRGRNDGVLPAHRLPRGRVVLANALEDVPRSVGSERAFAFWSDGWIADPQRLLIEYLRWSVSLGATIVNHADPTPIVRDGAVVGLGLSRATNSDSTRLGESSGRVEVETPLVVLSAGAWTETTLDRWGWPLANSIPTAKVFNLVLEGSTDFGRVGSDGVSGMGVRARDGRNAFLWSDGRFTHVGTVHRIEGSGPEDVRVTTEEAEALIRSVDEHVPSLELSGRRVVSAQVGRLPSRSANDPEMPHRDHVLSPAAFGGPEGLFVTMGLKYTTAPVVASRVVSLLPPSPHPPSPRPQGANLVDEPDALPPRPPCRGTIRIHDLLRSWESDEESILRLLRTLREEEAAGTLTDLVLGRMDGSEDPEAARELASRLTSTFCADEKAGAAQLEELERALEAQALRVS